MIDKTIVAAYCWFMIKDNWDREMSMHALSVEAKDIADARAFITIFTHKARDPNVRLVYDE